MASATTLGVFQLEGSACRDTLRKVRRTIRDVIRIISLYVPVREKHPLYVTA